LLTATCAQRPDNEHAYFGLPEFGAAASRGKYLASSPGREFANSRNGGQRQTGEDALLPGKPELLDFFADVRRQWYIQWTGLWGRDNE
jgi:hypothetical protein